MYKINLKLWLAAKLVPAVMVMIWYHLSIQPTDTAFFSYIRLALTAAVIVVLLFLGRKRDIIDESAKEILKRTDHICIVIFCVLSGLILSSIIIFIDDAKIVGYLVAGQFIGVLTVRVILFWIFDSIGMK